MIVKGSTRIKTLIEKGKNLFHVSIIKESYRIRGNEARTHTKIIATSIVIRTWYSDRILIIEVKKIEVVSSLIKRIFEYSAIKISANMLEPYSMLNPDTNSDSPSAKSNGVRLVSAKLVINHRIATGNIITIIVEYK